MPRPYPDPDVLKPIALTALRQTSDTGLVFDTDAGALSLTAHAPGILRLPGAHNGQAALQAKAAGFDALYLSGAAMTASMGLPDLGIITVDEVAFFIRQIVEIAANSGGKSAN